MVRTALLRSQQQTYLSDGLSLGIVLLVVPFGFIVGWILRSRLLTVNAGAVLSYILLTCILNGYLMYWPSALGWTRELLTCASAFSFVLFWPTSGCCCRLPVCPKSLAGATGCRCWAASSADSGG